MNYFIGTLTEKGGIIEVNDKFKKREFVIMVPDPKGNPKYNQEYTFTLIQDKVYIIDEWRLNDEIKVYFDIKGRRYNGKGYHDLNAWKIEGMKYDRPVEPKKETEVMGKPVSNQNTEDDMPF